MFAEVRHQQILNKLNESGSIKVKQLSKCFDVTEETIRRDLEKLESEQKLKRIHGGAILSSLVQDDDDIPFKDRKVTNKKEKECIAKKAVQLLQKDDVIFIDAGSTALHFAKKIPDIALKVITNSLHVAIELNKKKKIEVLLTGGLLSQNSTSLVGPATIQSIKKYHINKMFFSCKGFDVNWGISDSNEQQAAVKRAAIECSDTVILLVDHTKLDKKSFVKIDSIETLHYIVLDQIPDEDFIKNDVFTQIEII
ncbi:MAG: DeoR/GlpR family DNA-binding transcription regulator [Lysinibacillus sp.]